MRGSLHVLALPLREKERLSPVRPHVAEKCMQYFACRSEGVSWLVCFLPKRRERELTFFLEGDGLFAVFLSAHPHFYDPSCRPPQASLSRLCLENLFLTPRKHLLVRKHEGRGCGLERTAAQYFNPFTLRLSFVSCFHRLGLLRTVENSDP